jgi:hypothetical protein
VASIIWHPDTALGAREALEVRCGEVIYTLFPGVAQDIPQEHLSRVQDAIGLAAPTEGLPTPAAPTVTPTGGAAGSQTYTVVAFNDQGDSLQSAATNTAVGPTTLDATHYNTVSWTAVPGADGYKVIRTVGGPSQGLIFTVGSATLSVRDDNSEGAAVGYSSALLSGTATAATGAGGGVGITDSGQAWTTTGQGMRGRVVTMGAKQLVVASNDATHLNGFQWTSAGVPTTAPAAGAYTLAPAQFGFLAGPPEI